jgi:hypothetical protein
VPDLLTGADIAAAVRAGWWTDVADHVRAVVSKTVLLAARVVQLRLGTKRGQ